MMSRIGAGMSLRSMLAPADPAGDRDAGRCQPLHDEFLDPVAQHGAEDRDADRAADGPEEGHRGAGRADVLGLDRVLDGEDEVLHQQAQADAEEAV